MGLIPSLGVSTSAGTPAEGSRRPTILRPGERQLFLDLAEIEDLVNARQLFHTARKREAPVLLAKLPWENAAYAPTASFIYDQEDGIFKCWYMGVTEGDKGNDKRMLTLCYAISEDGIHWRRPQLGLYQIKGSRANNVVVPPQHHQGRDHWESVLKDPLAPDSSRYKGLGWSSYDWDGPLSGIYSMTSPDGLRWTHTDQPVFHYHPRPGTADLGPVGDAHSLMIDAREGRYVAFLRGRPERLYSVSPDFVHWSPPATSVEPPREATAPNSLYNHVGFAYGSRYLGLLSYFHATPMRRFLLDVRLLTSRDGLHYTLAGPEPLDRPPLVACGQIGTWDRLQTRITGAPPLRVGDELYFYYRGFSSSHDKKGQPRDTYPAGAIGLATLRVDGFVSLAAGFDGGQVTTRPLKLPTGGLHINAKANHHARVVAEILDERGEPLPGYGAKDCVPIKEDRTDHTVMWKEKQDLSELAGQPLRLRFHLTNARLYSYWIS